MKQLTPDEMRDLELAIEVSMSDSRIAQVWWRVQKLRAIKDALTRATKVTIE